MSTSLHAIFKLCFGNIYFSIFIFDIHVRKLRFSTCSQISPSENSEKSIFGHVEVDLLNVKIFSRLWVVNFCYYIQMEVFPMQRGARKQVSLKQFFNFLQKYRVWPILTT